MVSLLVDDGRAAVIVASPGACVRAPLYPHSSVAMPPILLRVRLNRADGIQVSPDGVVESVPDAGKDGLFVDDCVLWMTKPLAPEVSVLRNHATLSDAWRAHGLPISSSSSSADVDDDPMLPCFRLLKLPLRRPEEGGSRGLAMKGARVVELSGLALADKLLKLGDVVVAVNGRRLDGSLAAALQHAASSPIQILTVIRRCAEHDLPVATIAATTGMDAATLVAEETSEEGSGRSVPAEGAQSSTTTSSLATRAPPARLPPVLAPPPPLSTLNVVTELTSTERVALEKRDKASLAVSMPPFSLSAAASKQANHPDGGVGSRSFTEERPQHPAGSSSGAAAKGPAQRVLRAREAAAAAIAARAVLEDPSTAAEASQPESQPPTAAPAIAFEPLDDSRGLWSDLPAAAASNGAEAHATTVAYDAAAGVWSDLPQPSHPPPTSKAAGRLPSTWSDVPQHAVEMPIADKAALDRAVRAALEQSDDKLLRQLVAAQQGFRRA